MAKLSKELVKAAETADQFSQSIIDLTKDACDSVPKAEQDAQTKLSKKELSTNDGIYLKPERSIGPSPHPKTGEKEKFNEKFRTEYEFKMEYVPFIAENKEIIGEAIELWTKPYPGIDAQFWKIPVNKKVYGPRHLAERISGCRYTRLRMDDTKKVGEEGGVTYLGQMIATQKLSRLSAVPIKESRAIGFESEF